MAEVYRARDTRLGRDIALKVVNEVLCSDRELVRRFEQEARVAGSLNHPNLVAVYDVGEHEGSPYLVTELLDGESLRHRLMDDTVTPTGAGVTATGAVLGTPGYMSPEQVRGEPLDARADIFSLGAVLYEMLTGHRAFHGTTPVESGYAVLHTDPEALPPEVPPAVAQVVQRCMQKEPARRFESASDLAFALDVLRGPTATAVQPPRGASPGTRKAWLLAGAALVVGAIGALLVLRRPTAVKPPTGVLPTAERITFRWGSIGGARLLRDGRVAYSATFEGRPEEVFVRPPGSAVSQALDLSDTSLLSASADGDLAVLIHPRISLGQLTLGTVARVPSAGGKPRELVENAEFADWSPRGDLAIVREGAPHRVLEFPPGHVLFRTEGWISDMRFSPAGDRIAFLHHPVPDDDMGEVVLVDLDGRPRTLTKRWPTSQGLAWSPDGREVWFSAGLLSKDAVHAVSLDGKTRVLYRSLGNVILQDVAADGRILLEDILIRSEVALRGAGSSSDALLSWSDQNDPLAALSSDGRLLFSAVRPEAVSEGLQPYRVLIRGKDGSPAQGLGEGIALDLSPDARWALALSVDGRTLTVLPTGAGQPRQIPVHGLEFSARGARWAPDGKTLFVSARPENGDGPYRLHRLAEDGSTSRVSETGLAEMPFLEVSADGRWAAAVDENLRTVVISLTDGAARLLDFPSKELVLPRCWSREGHLWITEGGRGRQARNRLLRVDPRTAKVLEERSVGPADPGGASPVHDVVISADGREVAFSYGRKLGSLYLLPGLGR
jgi:hypothetical protein